MEILNNLIWQNAEDFKRRLQKFNNYLLASETNKGQVQVAVFLNCTGDDGLKIFNNLIWQNEDDKEDISIMIKQFFNYCEPRNTN